MKKYKIHIIIILMSCASIGLIALQFYWIDSSYMIQKESFKENVNNVLSLVSSELEKQEVLLYLKQDNTLVQYDTLQFPYGHNFAAFTKRGNSKFHIQIENDEDVLLQESRSYRFNFDDDENVMNVVRERIGKSRTDEINQFYKYDLNKDDHLTLKVRALSGDSVLTDSTFVFSGKLSFSERRKKIKKELSRLPKTKLETHVETVLIDGHEKKIKRFGIKERLPYNYLYGFTNNRKLIHDRVDMKQIDTLLTTFLNERGIDLNYKLSVYNHRANPFNVDADQDTTVEWISEGKKKKKLKKKKQEEDRFQVQLFPRDLVSANAFLSIQFDDQDLFIYKQILFPVMISIFLILIIITCFAISVSTIFRQKKLSELKNDFINNMTHELKTPISTISLATEGILKSDIVDKPKKLNQYGKIIFDENKRLGNHVERILKLSVMESGDIDLKYSDISIHEIIQAAVDSSELQIVEKGGQIDLQLDAVNDHLYADPDHIKNIIINLIDNAIKYSIEAPAIKISSWSDDSMLKISVQDHGIGLSKESQKMIFEKFYRVPTGNIHNVKGYGLGLSYVKVIVDLLGGVIEVDSELEKGTTFTLAFPFGINEMEN